MTIKQLSYDARRKIQHDLKEWLETFRGMTTPVFDSSHAAMLDNIHNLNADLDLYRLGMAGRKIIQVETCPINSIEMEGTIQTVNAVFALCDDGTLWMQMIGGGGEWTQIDTPQADDAPADSIYVIVADNDGGKDLDGPLIFEQYTLTADLASIKARVKYVAGKYGKCRIARLVFIDDKEAEKCASNSSAKTLSEEMSS